MFGLPPWVAIIVGSYLAFVVVNLIVFETAAYQLSRYGGTPFFRDWTNRLLETVLAVIWPFGWIRLFYWLGSDRSNYIFHLVETIFGNQGSMKWMIRGGYWKPSQ